MSRAAIMICQMIVCLLFHILPLDVVSGSQIEKNDGDKEVGVITFDLGTHKWFYCLC